MANFNAPVRASLGEPVPAGGGRPLPPQKRVSRRAAFSWATGGDQNLFHGTAAPSARDILQRGVRTNERPLQSQGPGFYVTPSESRAGAYAERASGLQGGASPVTLGVRVSPSKGISLKHEELLNVGRQFRRKHGDTPGVGEKSDAYLGNVALRQKGYDYLHIQEGPRSWLSRPGAETDFGVVLSPRAIKSVNDLSE